MRKSDLLKLFAVPAAAFVIGVAEPVLAEEAVEVPTTDVGTTPVENDEAAVPSLTAGVGVGVAGETNAQPVTPWTVEEKVEMDDKNIKEQAAEDDVELVLDDVVPVLGINNNIVTILSQSDMPDVIQDKYFGYIDSFYGEFDELQEQLKSVIGDEYVIKEVGQYADLTSENVERRQTYLFVDFAEGAYDAITLEYVDIKTGEVVNTVENHKVKKGATFLPGNFLYDYNQGYEDTVNKKYYALELVNNYAIENGVAKILVSECTVEEYRNPAVVLSCIDLNTGEVLARAKEKPPVVDDFREGSIVDWAAYTAARSAWEETLPGKLKALIPDGYKMADIFNGEGSLPNRPYSIYVVAEENGSGVAATTEVTNFKVADEEDTALGIPGAAVQAFAISGAGLVLARRKKNQK